MFVSVGVKLTECVPARGSFMTWNGFYSPLLDDVGSCRHDDQQI